jgi:hypothetical protein
MSPFCAGKCLDEEEIARRQNTRKRGSMKAEPAKLQMPLAAVTAIIPAYNEAANIEATIRSIQSQTYHVTQVIVVDDCSTDGTGDIARELGATVLRPPRNTGSKAAAQSYALPYVQTKFCVAIGHRPRPRCVRGRRPMTNDRPWKEAATYARNHQHRIVCGPTGADREKLAAEYRRAHSGRCASGKHRQTASVTDQLPAIIQSVRSSLRPTPI